MSTEDRTEEWVRMHLEEGLSFRAIGRRWGVSGERVRQVVRAAGITPAASNLATTRPWTCGGCGEVWRVPLGWRKRYHSQACMAAARERAREEEPARWHHARHRDGHWWVTDRQTKRTMRAARYLAQVDLGRELDRNEWVTLRDGDPDNLDPSNILVLTPKQTRAFIREHGTEAERRARKTRTREAA